MKGYGGNSQGDMSPKVKDMQKPKGCYTQSFDQAPLNYVERQNKRQGKEASKMKGEAFKGRY